MSRMWRYHPRGLFRRLGTAVLPDMPDRRQAPRRPTLVAPAQVALFPERHGTPVALGGIGHLGLGVRAVPSNPPELGRPASLRRQRPRRKNRATVRSA